MGQIALKMLWGDRAKYLGLVFGITFATLLMSQQVSIFIGLMARTASQILDVHEADLWVMDPQVRYVDEIKPLPDKQLSRVRGVALLRPKRTLTGNGNERVDTRVLQIIYAVEDPGFPARVGHEVDVYIEASPLAINRGGS
jgi:hypothetical protein